MRRKKRAIFYLLTTVIVTIAAAWLWQSLSGLAPVRAEAAAEKETVNLRILGTTDIHGQLNSKDYEQGVDYNDGGLARLADLIQSTKKEVPAESVITLDAGDTMYDYTTEYIFSESQEEIQPIFKAMAKIGYDAITLGNHDFDYGYEYILKQLNGSGLRDITVVSNVMDSKTGEHPFLENMLITRTLTTSTGKKVDVKIGIIGQTIPTLTAKTHSYVGILKTEDFVDNARAQAKKLKDMGADVIVALSHTGIGPENPEPLFKNQAYALTKIPEIDVVVCGHEHQLFPTSDMNSPYYKLPHVDKKTFLMNGKNVIMAGNRGGALGVVDLTLTIYSDGRKQISDRSSALRFVNASTTKEVKDIANGYGKWDEKLLSYSTDIIAKLGDDEVIQNYFGLLGDSEAIQLLNDAKIDYAQRFVQTNGSQYKNLPIVAASTYYAYGSASVQDFVNIRGSITESDLSSIQPYNNYVYIYKVTGKQLKEWLEWSASAYETTVLSTKWSAGTMSKLMEQAKLKSYISEDWLNDWGSFFIFDGIDYTVNPASIPRYDVNGNRISMGNRVSDMSYNGVPITDTMELLLVINKLTIPSEANQGIEKQVALNGFVRTQSVLSKYIKEISDDGSILPQLDYNWKVSIPEDYRFIVKVPAYASGLFEQSPWYQSFLSEEDQYRYYTAKYPSEKADKTGPHIVATPVITTATATPYKVVLNITDASGIKQTGYVEGDQDLDYFTRFSGLALASDQSFTVSKNGTYTAFAQDKAGNMSIHKIVITNFNDNLLASPTVDSYTNRKTKISGRGEPNTTIVFEAFTGTFESQIKKDGTYSYALPSQPSGSVVYVYVKEEAKGLESARVPVTVKRTGPNLPSVNPIDNTNGAITGDLDDDDAYLIAIIGNTVYVPKNGGKEIYEKNTEIYKPGYSIVEVGFETDYTGYFSLLVPPQAAGTAITFYNLDHVSRNSRQYETTVKDAGPNAPVVYEVSNIERSISGYVPSDTKKAYDMEITIGSHVYNTTTNENGRFSFKFTDQLRAGEIITVVAKDTKNDSVRYSYGTPVTVQNIDRYVRDAVDNFTLNKVTLNSYQISGSYLEDSTVYIAIAKSDGTKFINSLYPVETDSFGRYRYNPSHDLAAGDIIYSMVRFTDGNILMACKTEVPAAKPGKPVLVKAVTNADKQVQVAAMKNCEVTLKIGDTVYTTKDYVYDEGSNRYIYSFDTNRAVSGTPVKITAKNTAGTSAELSVKVSKAAPDQPKVKAVKSSATKITGTVDLIDYTAAEKTEEASEQFKDAPKKVAQTQTRIYAQIGEKTYEGTIDNNGAFAVAIPKQKAGTKIIVWGTNKAGRGPSSSITVAK